MNRIKDIFLYILALIVLLAPAIILGWIGLSLLGWLGLIFGAGAGLLIFVYSVNKIGREEAQAEEEGEALAPSDEETGPALSTVPPAETERR